MQTTIDFERSRLIWRTRHDSWGEWRIVASAHRAGEPAARHVLAPLVMAGNVYGSGRLPQSPAYTYQVMAGPQRHAIWRDYGDGQRHSADANDAVFALLRAEIATTEARPVGLDRIAAGTHPWPLAAVLTATAPSGEAWVLELPVDHLNRRRLAGRFEFQVETGPVLVPQALLPPGAAELNEGFALAYLYFSRLDRADLALAVVTASEGRTRRSFAGYHRLERITVTLLGRA